MGHFRIAPYSRNRLMCVQTNNKNLLKIVNKALNRGLLFCSKYNVALNRASKSCHEHPIIYNVYKDGGMGFM